MLTDPNKVDRYKQLSKIRETVNHDLFRHIPKNSLIKFGKELGLVKKKTFVFKSEYEGYVLVDYAIHNNRKDSKNIPQILLEKGYYEVGTDKHTLLSALANARYTIILVEDIIKNVGVEVKDIEDNKFLLMDIGFSNSAEIGTVLATRIINPENLHMTTGAALVINQTETIETINRRLQNLLGERYEDDYIDLSPSLKYKAEKLMLQIVLKTNAARYMAIA